MDALMDGQSKKPVTFSKEFIALLVAIAGVIFGAGVNYTKLESLEQAFSDFKRTSEAQTAVSFKAQNDQGLAIKLLEMRMQSLEQQQNSKGRNHYP